MKQERDVFALPNKIILIITTIILVALEFYSLTTDSHYKWDFVFLMILLYGLFFIRKRIDLHPLHFALAAVFLILHNLGTFGTYSYNYFGFEYDLWVHGFFGFMASLLLYRTYYLKGPYKGWFMYVAIIAVVLGFSAFHELFEYAGALAVGEGEGVLFIGAGDLDEWDTQKDMLNNLIGGLLGIFLYKITRIARGKSKN
jgi:uncharacterized membrane protein YjdF